MNELEERINRVLKDPTQLEQITRLAQSFMGGGESRTEEESQPMDLLSSLEIDPQMLRRLGALLGKEKSGKRKDTQALLEAMKPCLSDARREKMERAMKLARMARLLDFAMGELGGGEDD